MANFVITVPDALVSLLQQEVARYNAGRFGDNTPEIDVKGLLHLWLAPRVQQLSSDALERDRNVRNRAYESASPAVRAQVDAALNAVK